MMDIKVEPLRLSELDDFIKLCWAAFEPLEVDSTLPMIYPWSVSPNNLQPEVYERLRNHVLGETGDDVGSHCFCAKNIRTGEIAGVSWWAIVDRPARTREEIDEEFAEAEKRRHHSSPVIPGMNYPLEYASFKAAFYSEYETSQGSPHMSLRLLATHPKHLRRGIGSLLLRHGTEWADSLNLPIYLESGICGRQLYMRFGWKVTRDFPFDGRDFGGRSEGRSWCMMRPARSPNEAPKVTVDREV